MLTSSMLTFPSDSASMPVISLVFHHFKMCVLALKKGMSFVYVKIHANKCSITPEIFLTSFMTIFQITLDIPQE